MSGRTREGRDSGGQRGRIRGRLGREQRHSEGEGERHTECPCISIDTILLNIEVSEEEKSSKGLSICESK